MIEMTLMDPSKETDNKLRWEFDVDGVKFKLYIPKKRVPEPWPKQIKVSLEEVTDHAPPSDTPPNPTLPIGATIERVSEHSETVRFSPYGDPKTWEIGEPYIPLALLPRSDAAILRMEVQWDFSSGTWNA